MQALRPRQPRPEIGERALAFVRQQVAVGGDDVIAPMLAGVGGDFLQNMENWSARRPVPDRFGFRRIKHHPRNVEGAINRVTGNGTGAITRLTPTMELAERHQACIVSMQETKHPPGGLA